MSSQAQPKCFSVYNSKGLQLSSDVVTWGRIKFIKSDSKNVYNVAEDSILLYIHIENSYFFIVIIFHIFYCIFGQINAALKENILLLVYI